jgi:hypothetical protein
VLLLSLLLLPLVLLLLLAVVVPAFAAFRTCCSSYTFCRYDTCIKYNSVSVECTYVYARAADATADAMLCSSLQAPIAVQQDD